MKSLHRQYRGSTTVVAVFAMTVVMAQANCTLLAQPRTPGPFSKSEEIPTVVGLLSEKNETIILSFNPLQSKIDRSENPIPYLPDALMKSSMSLAYIADGSVLSSILKSNIDLSVFASRDFRLPPQIGPAQYQGIQVLLLNNSSAINAEDVLNSLHNPEDSDGSSSEHGGLVQVETDSLYGFRTIHVAAPSRRVLILATDLEEAKALISSLKNTPSNRSTPKNLHGWNYLLPGAEIVAYRSSYLSSDPEQSAKAEYDRAKAYKAIAFSCDKRLSKSRLVQCSSDEFSESSVSGEWQLPVVYSLARASASTTKQPLSVSSIEGSGRHAYDIKFELGNELQQMKVFHVLMANLGHRAAL